MITKEKAAKIAQDSSENIKKETEKFCENILTELILKEAENNRFFLSFTTTIDSRLRTRNNCYFTIPSTNYMWEILLDAGFIVDKTSWVDGETTWTIRWDNDSTRELERSL